MEEFKKLVEGSGLDVAYDEIDIVTTGTFGAMCSSGAVINVGHADPPIKIQNAWINDVPICHPGAAVDLFIGATSMSETRRFEYGGGHVIEDLVTGKDVELRATAYGTDCYPRRQISTSLTKDDLNQFCLLNFRNAYQRYACAVNSGPNTIYTYMGKLLPSLGNATFSGSGELSPLMNDSDYETIGIGTRIFLGGAQGYVIGEGTQHNPQALSGTLMVKGDANRMSQEFLRGASFTGYGTSLYVGLGIPIPLLNTGLAEKASIRDEQIYTDVIDYGVPRRDRPKLKKVNYKELKSGRLQLGSQVIRVSPLTSLSKAREIAEAQKRWIEEGLFYLSTPVERIPLQSEVKTLTEKRKLSSPVLTVRTGNPGESEKGSNSRIRLSFDKCLRCGHCVTLCAQKAITFSPDFFVTVHEEKCVSCGLCIDACPVRALSLHQ